ncbi:Flp family type IVb pilin [Vibrio astriarenae]|uniref:Flp family type IVb pilin n=1 Tax=Vibrio astriarenae TaxID=1481923 RepID=A0A7Z2T487_9VIBR|nr:Flp family type IVb pilin [Vibrio astriarenae]QIA64079.1 Flp family type IVb pilin [Vibrio astriarenae]
MKQLTKNIKAFMQDEEGLTVVEYVVGAALLVIALGVMFQNWGTILQGELADIFT